MTEEGGSEQLGTLEVAIAGSLTPLEAALAKAEQMLQDFDKKFGSTTAKAGRAAGKQGRAARTAAADAAPASAASDAPRGPINVNIKTDGLKNSINEELGGEFKIKIVTDEIQVKIDQQFLRNQVLEAFRGLNLNLGADVAGAGRAFNTGTQPQGGPPQPRVFPKEVTNALTSQIDETIHTFYSVLNNSLEAAGRQPVGHLHDEDPALDKMAEIAKRFDLTSGKLVEFVDENGKRGRVTGGVFGPTSSAIAGLDPGDIKQIGHLAQRLSIESAPKRFLSQFFEALPNVQREQPRQAPYQPPQDQPTASNIGEAVASAIKEERPAAAPAEPAERGKRMEREDFIDYVRRIAGTGRGSIPAARDIAVPAKFALEGETPLESLQATKRGAGRAQAIQGGLGPLTEILRFAERGGFENFAEIQKNGRPTGTFVNYDPESVEGRRVRSNRFGYFGDTPVRAANPIDLLEMTLKRLFPGIEKRADPTQAMTSVLERVLVGPGAQAIAAGKRLTTPGRGYNPDVEAPNQTSEQPAGGPFTGGLGTSTGSLRRGYQDYGEMYGRVREEVRGQLFDQTPPGSSGQVDQDRVEEITQANIRRAAALAAENAKASAAASRERVARGENAEAYPGDIRPPGSSIRSEAAATREEMASTGVGFGRYIQLFNQIAESMGPGSLRSTQLSGRMDRLPPGIATEASGTGAFTTNIVRALMEQVDEEIYDELELTGRRRHPAALPDYIQAERAAFTEMVYGPQRRAEEDLSRRGDPGGGRRTQMRGGTRTGVSTPGGAAEFIPEPVRPSTTLEIEKQALMRRSVPVEGPTQTREGRLPRVEIGVEAEARRIAEARLKKIQADREASGVAPELLDKLSVEDILYAPPTRSAGAAETKSPRTIKPDIMEEVKQTTDVGRRYAEIEEAQASARRALGALSPNLSIDAQRTLTRNNASLSDEARQEALEILESRFAEAATRPNTTAARQPTSGDRDRQRFREAGGFTPPGEESPRSAFSGFNAGLGGGFNGGGGGVGVGGPRGREFVPGGAPIEVIVVGKFPLPVELVGSSTGGGTGRAGMARKNIRDIPADEVGREDTKPPASESRISPAQAAMRTGVGASGRAARAARARYGPGFVPAESREDRQAMYERLFRQRDKEDAAQYTIQYDRSEERLARQREREEAAAAAAPEKEQLARERYQSRERRRAKVSDPLGFAAEQDVEDTEQRDLRGQLRILNRSIPRRGFGASLTDLISSIAPGHGALERQLEAGDLANREAAEIARVSTQRAQTRTTLRGLTGQINAAQASGNTERVATLTQLYKEQETALAAQNKQIEISTTRFQGFYQEATKGTTVLKSFAAAGIGGAVAGGLGAIQFGLGTAIVAPIITAVSEGLAAAVGPAFERLSGFAGTASRITGAAADQVTATGLPGETVLRRQFAAEGLSAATIGRFAPILAERADTEAGNKQLQKGIDDLNAFIKVRGENLGRGGDLNLTRSTGGFFGLGGTASTAELVSTQFDLLKTQRDRDVIKDQLQQGASALANSTEPVTSPTNMELGRQLQMRAKILADEDATIGFFNDALRKGGEGVLKFTTETGKATQAQRDLQEKAFRDAGAAGLADKIREGRALLTENGAPISTTDQVTRALQAIANPRPDPQALLEANKGAIAAQNEARFTRLRLQTQTLLPTQLGIEGALNPLPPPEAGINTEGLTAKQVKAVNAELGNTQKLFAQYNDEVQKGQQQVIDFVTNGADVFGTGTKVGGLGPQAGADFAAALQKASGYASQIQSIQIDQITKQAAYAADQYAYQISIAKRNLADAKALSGQIVGDNQNLGRLQREQFQLQRESQQLSLELSQRQINFQVALANFQAPGLSSEEREARKQAAKIEAEYAQKQLDIQKQLFGLAGKGFQISASRNVSDLVGQLSLLEKGRVLTIDTAVAEKKILYLTKLQEKENKRVEAYYSAAVEATNDVISLTQDLASQTGKSMSELARDVIKAYITVIRGIQDNLYHSYGDQTGSNPGKAQDDVFHASGGVFQTSGMTRLTSRDVVGEAGGETVAILANPRPYNGGGGMTQQVNIYVTGNTVRKDEDLDALARKIEQRFNERGAQVGLRPF